MSEQEPGSNHNSSQEFLTAFDYDPLKNAAMSPVQAAYFSLIVVFFLYQIGGSIITLAIFGLNLESADINIMRILTAGGQILLILAPALIFSKLVYNNVPLVIRLKMPSMKEAGLYTIGLLILIPTLQTFLYLQNFLIQKLADSSAFVNSIKTLFDKLNELVETTYGELLSATNFYEGIFIVFVVAVVPGICEEVFFRGFVQKSFEQKYRPAKAIIITSLFFGLYHFNPYGLIPLIVLGIYLGYSAYRSDSILIPVMLHFLNNFITVTAYFIFGSEEIFSTNVIDAESISSQTVMFFILLAVFIFFMNYLNNFYSRKKTNGGDYDMS